LVNPLFFGFRPISNVMPGSQAADLLCFHCKTLFESLWPDLTGTILAPCPCLPYNRGSYPFVVRELLLMKAVNKGIDERIYNTIVATNAQAPFYQLTGIQTKTLGPGWVEMSVNTESRHGNPLGLIHGGLVSTLADAAMANAVRTTGKKGVTVHCDINFLAAAPVGQEMIGRGQVDRAGAKIVFTSGEVVCGDKVVATCQATFYVVGEM
jgi:uncharacterized protein (TIGR00369 family)